MSHYEDEQPNESVRGRPKRIVPFIRDTTRGRGRGAGRGSSNPNVIRNQDHGFARGVPPASVISRGGLHAITRPTHISAPLQYTKGDPSSKLADAFPPKSQPTMVSTTFHGSQGVSTAGPSNPHSEDHTASRPPRPRRRWFRPGVKNRLKNGNNLRPASDSKLPITELPNDNQSSLCAVNDSPPAKRPRFKGDYMDSHISSPTSEIKVERERGGSVGLPPEQPTTGTKFISYDNFPLCRFGCDKPPEAVRDNRRLVKEQEVLALRKLGRNVNAVFIRDDGIAIDWSTSTESKDEHISSLLPSEDEMATTTRSTPPLQTRSSSSLDKPLPSHLNPIIISSNDATVQRSYNTTMTEIAYRQLAIPPRHLPRLGNTRKLEIWVLEQMRLLEAELGPVLLPPPELVGVCEYVAGQGTPEGVKPYLKIPYKRAMRACTPDQQSSLHSEPRVPPTRPSTTSVPSCQTHSPSDDLSGSTLPPIAHLSPPHSPTPSNNPPCVKNELDELVHNPPSPLSFPSPQFPNIAPSPGLPLIESRPSNQPFSSPNSSRPQTPAQALACNEVKQGTSLNSQEDFDEIQRLRQELELSRLEAEKRHRDLERRILELSDKHFETHAPRPDPREPLAAVPKPSNSTRIVDEGQSKLLVLRRGKHDKTRRLLAASDNTILHISWLGVLQLVNRNSRQIIASGSESTALESLSVEDACLLSSSSIALALMGSKSQLAIATHSGAGFKFCRLREQPHEAKGICAVVSTSSQSAITLGHDHHYVHWKFDQDSCSTKALSLPKLNICTALSFDPINSNVVTAGSDGSKRSKLTLHNLARLEHIPNTVELSNHPHHIHIDPENPAILVLELARLDDQFQVHDIRLPLYQCVQKFGYQNVVHERAEFRVRGSIRGHYFTRGDTGIARLWDRRATRCYQTVSVVPHQRVVEAILDPVSLMCATEAHQVVTYPIF